MKEKILILILSVGMIFSLSACKKKETQPPVPQTPGPMVPGQMPPGQMPPSQMPPSQMPPSQMPPSQMPPSQMPPSQMPPSQMPPSQMPPSQMPPMGQQAPRPGMTMGKMQVAIPDSVKGKWSSAKIVVENKIDKTKQEYTVKLNSDFKIPNSNLKIHVGEFLPDFKMEGLNLTSGSNEPRNPALGIRVLENNKQIFPAAGRQWGWLFAKVPSIHPFEHSKYAITLKEGIKKG